MSKRYRAVDLDGVLAEYDTWNGYIGEPVPRMVKQVKQWLADGDEVTIFTARVSVDPDEYSPVSGHYADHNFAELQRSRIREWCIRNIGVDLEITAIKTAKMTDFYDDRAYRVESNSGRIMDCI